MSSTTWVLMSVMGDLSGFAGRPVGADRSLSAFWQEPMRPAVTGVPGRRPGFPASAASRPGSPGISDVPWRAGRCRATLGEPEGKTQR